MGTRTRRLIAALGILATVGLALAPPPATADPADSAESEPIRSHIVGGTAVRDGHAEWTVALLDASVPEPRRADFCAGAVVHARWVLTAAHCLDGEQAADIEVLAGTQDLSAGGQRLAVNRIVRHPGYVAGQPYSSDVALLRLAEPTTVAPVGVATAADWRKWAPGADAVSLGWGASDPQGGIYRTRLRKAATPIVADSACTQARGAGFEMARLVCAGDIGAGTCAGDSGGPLVAGLDEGEAVLVGTTIGGSAGDCGIDPYNFYAETATFLPWIEGVTGLDLGAGAPMRVAGADVLETAVAVSRHSFAPGQAAVHVATSKTFADGLVGGALAAMRGPLLLVPPGTEVPATVAAEIARLRPEEIVIFGGTAAVSAEIAEQLAVYAPIRRLSGRDRFVTAAQIASEWRPGVQTAFVATGIDYPDAIAAVPLAAFRGPILLTRPDRLPAATVERLEALQPAEIVVLGGASAVSDSVAGALAGIAPVRRVRGEDRYATAARIAVDPQNWQDPPFVYVATGQGFAHALTAGVAASFNMSPLLLTRADAMPSAVHDALARLDADRAVIVGDADALSDAVAARIHEMVRP